MVHFLFDLDGLLVDSEPMQLESFIELAKRYQKNINPKFRKEYIGKSANQNISLLFNTKDAIQLKKLEKEKQDIIFSIIKEKGLKEKKGVRDFIKRIQTKFRLKNLKNLHVVSSSTKKYIKFFLKTANLYNYFYSITSGDEVKKNKPSPDIYLLAAKKIGIPPSQCIAFEDTVSGVKAAKSAGTTVIAIPSKDVDLKEIAKYSDKVYKSFFEIKNKDLISLSL